MNTLELLEHEEAVMLPDREALDFLNFTHIDAINVGASVVNRSHDVFSLGLASQTISVVNGPVSA
jgi:hypothetical protein